MLVPVVNLVPVTSGLSVNRVVIGVVDPRTTLVIKSIPRRLDQLEVYRTLLNILGCVAVDKNIVVVGIDKKGPGGISIDSHAVISPSGRIDFLYLPLDSTRRNYSRGFAFANFRSPMDVQAFATLIADEKSPADFLAGLELFYSKFQGNCQELLEHVSAKHTA